MIASEDELLAQYDEVKKPDVDPSHLASWLLSIALKVEHVPRNQNNAAFSQKWLKDLLKYARSVTSAVEIAIVNSDSLINIREGIEATLLLIRL